MKLLLKRGRVIDPASKLDRTTDVLIENGLIAKIEDGIDAEDARTVEASGLVVCPGFIDMHVHLREPGEEWKETVKTGPRVIPASGDESRNVERINRHIPCSVNDECPSGHRCGGCCRNGCRGSGGVNRSGGHSLLDCRGGHGCDRKF